MGQFSWLDCMNNKQILDDVYKDVYVLVPKEFGGGHIVEHCYNGYGDFSRYDIYELVADWNRKYLTKDFEFPYAKYRAEYVKKYQQSDPTYTEKIDFTLGNKKWADMYLDPTIDRLDIEKEFNIEYRWIGIALACYDEDNEALPFPIKITYDKNAVYENCEPSKSDPNQGWLFEEEDDENEWY